MFFRKVLSNFCILSAWLFLKVWVCPPLLEILQIIFFFRTKIYWKEWCSLSLLLRAVKFRLICWRYIWIKSNNENGYLYKSLVATISKLVNKDSINEYILCLMSRRSLMKEWDIGANCYRKRLGMLKK